MAHKNLGFYFALILMSFFTLIFLLNTEINRNLFEKPNQSAISIFLARNSSEQSTESNSTKCSMKSCFNSSPKCSETRFKFYIHEQPTSIVSDLYKNIISTLKSSAFVTDDANEACLFILSIDTIDRDKLSKDYLQNLSLILNELSYWSNGRNFLVFNLYTGTWPDYKEPFDVDLGQAILAKASFTYDYYRTGFDISLPLFYSDLSLKSLRDSNTTKQEDEELLNRKRKYLLSFKGKRYLHGVGSKVRNSLYHLNNNRDIVMLTSCKHGTNWMRHNRDERCDKDNELYDQFDYNELLNDSVFCLVPRGRRVGTFRFIEALKSACIPVVLSNNWVMPFMELIDWKQAVFQFDENYLSHIPFTLREIPFTQIFQMRKECLYIYKRYFSSYEAILNSTIQIIKNRISKFPL